MAFTQWDYDFDGAYPSAGWLETIPGVYVIWCKTGNKWEVLDVGQSENVRNHCKNHDRTDCWKNNCSQGRLRFTAHYMPDAEEESRIQVVKDIRNRTDPPCGR